MRKVYLSFFHLAAGFGKQTRACFTLLLLTLLLAGVNEGSAQTLTQTGFTSVLTPLYMSSGTNTRLPVMFRATVTGLTSATTYRFYIQGATNASTNNASVDIGTTNPGAGNSLLINSTGTTYTLTSNPSATSAGGYETFTTDASGNYTGWFGFVNTGNGRFTAGNIIYPSIVIANTSGVILHRRALDVTITVLAFGTGSGSGATAGSFLKETSSSAIPKNLVAIYDNTDGTGRPIALTTVEPTGAIIPSAIPGYTVTAGGWNAIIPNSNANGIRRIEQRSVTTGDIIGCNKDADGIWPTGSVNTTNPTSGTAALIIASADAPLNVCCNTITVTANAGPISCPGGTTTVTVSASGGTAPYSGTGVFTVGAGAYTYNITDANGCPGSKTITIAAVADTVKPGIYLQGSSLLAGQTGPSTTQSPYLKSSKPGVQFRSMLSVNDVVGGYRMVGIPDGLGAFDNGNGTFTVLMNHELTNTVGIARAHGSKGTFVSKWIVNKSDLSITSGSDLMQQVYLWNPTTSSYSAGTLAFSRFCSADLPAVSAFYNSSTGLGTTERIFMNGEESGAEGKALGHIVTGAAAGVSYELSYLGKFAWENSVANPASGDKTVVAGMDDGTGGQVYIYVGNKTNTGTDIDKAGLSNGKLYGVKVTGMTLETSAGVPAAGTRFSLADLGSVQNKTGATLESESIAAGVTTFLRPEDGAWDPKHPNDLYFATTNAFNSPTRLWRLRFDNVATPESGGTIEAVLNGTEGGQMFDNITVDKLGHITLVEDVGNNAHIGKIWQYNTTTDVLTPIAYHDSTRFLIGGANFLTQDEEASGVLDVSEILGPGMYLVDVQAHYAPAANTTEVVEGGQLLAMYNPNVFGTSTALDTIRSYDGCSASINLGIPATADDCNVASVVNNAPSSFPVDTTIVTWTVTDGSGNIATIDQVVIVADSTAPSITAPSSLNISTNDGCTATGVNLGNPVVTDNCSIDTVYNNAPAAFPLGATTVTWTAVDISGNTATATQTVTVTDTLSPAIYLLGSSLLVGQTGPSTTQSPYLKSSKPGVQFRSMLSVNDVVGGYRMVGIPDGLGAFDNGNGTFTVLMNHELTNTVGIARAHGSKGTFVSKWIVNKSDLSITSGSDLMQQVYLWNPTTSSYSAGTLAFSRFCSADLPAVSAFYNSSTGLGTTERIFMNGEESGAEGKALGHIVTGAAAGVSYELSYLGKFAWENSVANPASGDKTLVAGMDDGTGGQVYIYVGNKTNTGTDIDKAGLSNGKLYGVKVTGMTLETSAGVPAAGTRFSLADLGSVQNKTGATLESESIAAGVTTFLRPEDGAWDPKHPNDLYFATTNAFNSPTRLWRLRFDNVATPESGGTIEAVLNGTEGGQMFDNITVDKLGHITLVEDVGNNAHIGKIWQYNTTTDVLTPIAYHDSTRFLIGGANFLTQDEEASGVLDVSEILGPGMYLVDVQAHYAPAANTTEVVEGGQLLAMYNPNVFGTSTALDTIRVSVAPGIPSATVSLGVPSTADNCSVASVTNNAPSSFPVGTTIVIWTVTDGSGNTKTIQQVVIVTEAPNQKPTVTITTPSDNSSYAAGTPINLQATAADADGTITKVEFYDNGVKFLIDSIAPYGYTTSEVEPGNYVITAKAFDNSGDSTVSDTVRVTVTACTGSGTISAEGFANIPGPYLVNLGSDFDYPNNPDVVTAFNKFEYGPNLDDNYGARLRGYICAPQTGFYVFYVASNDHSELYLSTDDSPANAVKIAFVQSSTVNFRAWNTNPSQRSIPIRLVKGARYYIETIHKEATGQDHLSVGWAMPNGVFEGPIPGNRLSPFLPPPAAPAPLITSAAEFGTAMRAASAKAKESTTAASGLEVTATPNPSNSHFMLKIRSNRDENVSVTLTDGLGRTVERKTGIASNGTVQVGNNLAPAGLYFAEVQQGDQKVRLKLVKQ